MTRRRGPRQLQLFDVSDLDDEGDGKAPPDGRYGSWDEVMADLGLLLRQARFELYLARRESEDRGEQR